MHHDSPPQLHPFEALLRDIAAEAPSPWYPRRYARATGLDEQRVNQVLELLWLEGLLQKAGFSPEFGGGVTLSEQGRKVLESPELLRRLKAGESVNPDSRAARIRQALMNPATPYASRAALAINLGVFLVGLVLAWQGGFAGDYL